MTDRKTFAPDFQIAVLWTLPRDVVAACACAFGQIPLGRGVTTLTEHEHGVCAGKRVLLCGTYLDVACVERLVADGCAVTCYTHSAEDRPAYGAAVTVTDQIYTAEQHAEHPEYALLERRTGPDAEEGDEAWYRGVLHLSRTRFGLNDSYDVFQALVKRGAPASVDECTAVGRTVLEVLSGLSESLARMSSRIVSCGKLAKCRIIVSGVATTMPYVLAAYEYDGGCDAAISVRHWTDGRVSVTVYSKTADLDFLLAPEYGFGGKSFCRSKTYARGDFVYDSQASSLDDMIYPPKTMRCN